MNTDKTLERGEVLRMIVDHVGDDVCLISPLGYITRDLFSLTAERREQCFYCMGSMGSVVPLALGVSLSSPAKRVFAIEGDGSLLMNLGALVTLRRYGKGKILLFVFDNRCYESTGGQPSQPQGFNIEEVCRAAGLETSVATDTREIEQFFELRKTTPDSPAVLVIKVALAPPRVRVDEEPKLIADRFSNWLSRRR
jgi:Thiamine pyrophosphate-requiring enzymes [acetolactate synthase, pyruvate dehydrogenase (cytochrome), glyoxylate carboligase, phosphonopyruvate decarboxylase]